MKHEHRPEHHLVSRLSWLRAAVLGANDGIISVSSLIVGIASSSAGRDTILLSGLAALVAGAMSMAAGEFVSVSSQADIEHADLTRERNELSVDPNGERRELAGIYVNRGLSPSLADQVADELMTHDALGAHARDELGLTEEGKARPLQAALASAASFTGGAVIPVFVSVLAPRGATVVATSLTAVALLAVLGAIGATFGGARRWRAVLRVTFWGIAALLVTAGIGQLADHAMGTSGQVSCRN